MRTLNQLEGRFGILLYIALLLLAMLCIGFQPRRAESAAGFTRMEDRDFRGPKPIEVLKPNGGETYTRGIKKKMTWSTTLDPSERVRIELLRFGDVIHVIDKSTANDGLYKLTFPQEAEPGGGYKVRALLKRDTNIFDQSDKPFTVE
ncbi:MAG: hypothetical protein HUU46_10800 [Candidatus Hydrogenedentes bacterium]|nr:hypothetical protein [Candidatus Hydrogenedentota bacterium]